MGGGRERGREREREGGEREGERVHDKVNLGSSVWEELSTQTKYHYMFPLVPFVP